MSKVFTSWQMNWLALAGIVMLVFIYGRMIGFKKNAGSTLFVISIVLMVLCFFSPLHVLAMHYLFSAHMVVHVVLLLLAGPLLVLSIPQEYDGTGSYFLRKLSSLIHKCPFIAWITGIGIMWLWHIPALFKMMVDHSSPGAGWIHSFQTVSLIASGFIYSLPVLCPYREYRLPGLLGVLYLFTACSGCSLLGLWITFAPVGTFPHYLSMMDPAGLNTIIQNQWSISQIADQQAAGLIMWVPCCMVYVSGAMFLLWRWFNEPDSIQTPKTTISAHLKNQPQ